MLERSISRSALRGVRGARGAHHAPQGTSFEPSAIAATRAAATLLGRTACGRRKSLRGVSREAFAGAVDGGATRTMLGRRSVVAVGEAVPIIAQQKSCNYFFEV